MTNTLHHHPPGKRRLRAYIRILTQNSTHICISEHIHKPCYWFVCMQKCKWHWPMEQSIVGGHGKHNTVLACNDTLIFFSSVFVCGVWK